MCVCTRASCHSHTAKLTMGSTSQIYCLLEPVLLVINTQRSMNVTDVVFLLATSVLYNGSSTDNNTLYDTIDYIYIYIYIYNVTIDLYITTYIYIYIYTYYPLYIMGNYIIYDDTVRTTTHYVCMIRYRYGSTTTHYMIRHCYKRTCQ